MIVVLTDTATEADLVRRVLDAASWKTGRPINYRLAATRGQSVAVVAAVLCDGPMTHEQAAAALGCSTRTIRRLVAAGTLDRHPANLRCVTAGSVARAARETAA